MNVSATPVITLLSDLGTQHLAISGIKVLLSHYSPDVITVDISHRIAPYNIQQAAYLTLYTHRHFPASTVHLLLVDIMFGERHRMLLAKVNGHYFIAPDNGTLSLAFGKELQTVWLCREFSGPVSVLKWAEHANSVIEVIKEGFDLNEYFSRFMIKEVAPLLAQKPIGARLDCTILHIDRYGNIVINLTELQFSDLINDGPFSIKFPGEKELTTLSRHYNDVEESQLLCRFNSMGYMEIAINHGSVADRFDLDITSDKGMNYSVVTINF